MAHKHGWIFEWAPYVVLLAFRGVLVDVAFKGVSVEPDFEDIESSYGKKV